VLLFSKNDGSGQKQSVPTAFSVLETLKGRLLYVSPRANISSPLIFFYWLLVEQSGTDFFLQCKSGVNSTARSHSYCAIPPMHSK